MSYISKLLFALLLLGSTTLLAQKQESFLIKNVQLHLGNGTVIENGAIGINAEGKIQGIYTNSNNAVESEFNKVIDGKGQYVYPSMIAPNTQLGIAEIESVRATNDFMEVGLFNPSIRSIIAYNADSDVLPTITYNGVLIAQTAPVGGRIAGQSSVVKLNANDWQDALISADNGVHLNFPARFYHTGWWAEPGKIQGSKGYDKDVEGVKVYFDHAAAYAQNDKPETKNLKFEVMREVFQKKKKLYIHAHEALAIMDAINLLKPYNLDMVLVGGIESFMIIDFLKANNIPVIYMHVHDLPNHSDIDTDQYYKTPVQLQKAGIKVGLGLIGYWQVRNLPFIAGNTVPYGLTKEEALRSITLSTAEILGIQDKVGSLEVGKDATFFISQGDVLDMRTSIVTAAFIQGKPIKLSSRQQALYEKYMDKFGFEK